MTVIAWDGTSLAVDKQCTYNQVPEKSYKYKILESQEVLVCSGEYDKGLILQDWYTQGGVSEDWPDCQTSENFTDLIVASESKIFEYGRYPVAMETSDTFKAWGTGRDIALGAMMVGSTPLESVRVAIKLNIYCGRGIDLFTWKDGKVIHQEFEE